MYFVTAIEIDEDGIENPFIHDSRCFGYYENKTNAIKAVVENCGDMHEGSFNFLVIEKIPEGIHPMPDLEELWFKWINDYSNEGIYDGYWIETGKPEWSEKIVNWALG